MHPFFEPLVRSFRFTGDLRTDIPAFLIAHRRPLTAEHNLKVGEAAREVALRFGSDARKAEIAGWLHDVSAVYPNDARLEAAQMLGLDILQEETFFPMILHQKLSAVMARDLFHVQDPEILDAIGCHTTLRAKSTQLDQVLFVADKIAWDQAGSPPYLDELEAALHISLKEGALAYIRYLWDRRDTLKVLHPWLQEAYEELTRGRSL